MYLQITTQCNMSCPHCSFSCEVGKPYEQMDWATFCDALSLCENYGEYVTIGGGEPTLHPDFWKFLREAVMSAYRGDAEGVWMATNGKKTETAVALAKLAGHREEWYDFVETIYDRDNEEILEEIVDPRLGDIPCDAWEKFDCVVSRDAYHAPIDPDVYAAFSSRKLEIRDVTWHVANIGAAKENQLGGKDRCACSSTFIAPDGTVKLCGCPDSLVLGHLSDRGELDARLERASQVIDETDECGYFGIRIRGSYEEPGDGEIQQDLVDFILHGENAKKFDPDYAYEDVDTAKAA